MAVVVVPFVVMCVFLAIMGVLVALAVRRSRRGYAWEQEGRAWPTDERTDGPTAQPTDGPTARDR